MTSRSPGFSKVALVALALCLAACTAKQPESAKTVAAFEVPLPSDADRNQFLLVLQSAAVADGMHLDAESKAALAGLARAIPQASMTLHAAVWRGANDDEPIAAAMDQHDHVGRIWLAFFRGRDPVLSERFREDAMREIMKHWPDTLSLPIMPTGAIPLPRDLIRTPNGYIVNPAQEYRYQLRGTEAPAQ